MESYLMMVYVTLEQESALKTFFLDHGWAFCKPDLSYTTDKLGPAAGTFPNIVRDDEFINNPSAKTLNEQSGKRKLPPPHASPSTFKRSNVTKSSDKVLEESGDNLEKPDAVDSADREKVVRKISNPITVQDIDGNSKAIKVEVTEEDDEYDPSGNYCGNADDVSTMNDDYNDDTDLDESYGPEGGMLNDSEMSRSSHLDASLNTDEDDSQAGGSKRKQEVKPDKIDRPYRRYSPESLLKAYEAVKDKKIPVKTAARQYGVPLTTLRDRVDRRIDANNFAIGGITTLSMEKEEILVEHLEEMSHLGYSYSNTKLQKFAGELAFDLGKKEKIKPMSNNWLSGFLNRWKSRLASLTPSYLDSDREKSCTPEAVAYYFNNLNEIMSKYDLFDKPQCIYNLHETGLKPEHRPPNVASASSCKPQAIPSPGTTTTTLIGCINAIGNAVPPFFVFRGKRFNSDLMNGASLGARGEVSESGWSNCCDLFKTYLKEHFMPYARLGADDSQVILLLLDGHTSHVSPSLIRWANTQNLILLVLPAHSSNFLQPLDVSLFGSFRTLYFSECSSFMQTNIRQVITKFNICELACKAYLKAMTPLNIQAGFWKTGIYPLSKDAIPMEKLFPTEDVREEEPVKKDRAGKEALKEFMQKKMDSLNTLENVNI